MTELSGTLAGVGLPAIVRFLSGLKKTGCLRVIDGEWHGEIVFEAGQVTDVSFGSRSGLDALDALVQVLPSASFSFDTSPRASTASAIEPSPEALQVRLDELVARIANGTPSFPSVGAVPTLVVQAESAATEDPVPLDRGTLQTLVAVDGHRTVREIVAQRGSFDALWQLGALGEAGLVRLGPSSQDGRAAASAGTPTPAEPVNVQAAPPGVAPPLEPSGPDVEPGKPPDQCPKLGFEDDPRNSFARPTRLHRCFAADTPLPLSLDQQRELCLSDQFGTCPRLSLAGRPATRPPVRGFRTPSKAAGVPGGVDPLPDEAKADNPRIVRLPIPGRTNVWPPRPGASDRQIETSSEPPQLLTGAAP
ncbi:MAG: DUF4388 domain-containing protein, partial [Chloroflexota bacterium]|nr:DUF4388 domain-containing protein [Chloroflexota bacterium]